MMLCLSVLACGDSPEPAPERETDSGASTAADAGQAKPDATSPAPVVDGATKPPDAASPPADAGNKLTDAGNAALPDAGKAARPDASNTGAPPATNIQDPDSLVSVCMGTGCPAGTCGVNTTSCDGLYDNALSGTYDFCPATAAAGNYCLVTCNISKINGDCDLSKAEKYRVIDCNGGKPSIALCGAGQGCVTSDEGVSCF